MKKILFLVATVTAMSAASAQTKPVKKADANQKEQCKKAGASCCAPSSKAKALIRTKPAVAAEKKG